MVNLYLEEARREQLAEDDANRNAPKYTVCFSDLAEFLGLKAEIMEKVA